MLSNSSHKEFAMLPYDLIFDERPNYLYACVRADDIDRDTALDYLQKVAGRASGSDYDRMMLERDIPVMLSSTDVFFTMQDFLKMVGTMRVAFVNKHATIESEMEFLVLIGTNRGAKYRLFRDVGDAEKWLLTKADS
jgi:hypothetical protein